MNSIRVRIRMLIVFRVVLQVLSAIWVVICIRSCCDRDWMTAIVAAAGKSCVGFMDSIGKDLLDDFRACMDVSEV